MARYRFEAQSNFYFDQTIKTEVQSCDDTKLDEENLIKARN